MAQQTINVGTAINDGTGDPARTAFTKSNDNFTEVYAADFVDNTRLANMAQATIKGRASGAGTGDPTDLTAAQVAGIISPAWTSYTPIITAASGTFTSVSATGKYLTLGKLTHVEIDISITTNGTAAGIVKATLPNTMVGLPVFVGREAVVTGLMCQGLKDTTTSIFIVKYDNTYPGSSGARIWMSGSYENT